MSINLFWVIVAAGSFIIFLNAIWRWGFDPIANILAERKARIDQGLKDADAAQQALAASQAEHERMIAQARRESAELIAKAQKAADDLRASDIAATRAELERLRVKATADIGAERDRALADLRAQVADLAIAAAGRVVGETMNDARQRKLVEDFLRDSSATSATDGTNGSAGRTN